jgi:hypothetical protein
MLVKRRWPVITRNQKERLKGKNVQREAVVRIGPIPFSAGSNP